MFKSINFKKTAAYTAAATVGATTFGLFSAGVDKLMQKEIDKRDLTVNASLGAVAGLLFASSHDLDAIIKETVSEAEDETTKSNDK